MSISLQGIQTLIDNGDKKRARHHLKKILKDNPSADAWYLAALTMESDADTLKCLRKTLKLDELHTPANRLLLHIEGMPVIPQQKQADTPSGRGTPSIDRKKKVARVRQQSQQKTGRRRRVGCGCLFSMLLSSIFTIIVFTTIGLLPGVIGTWVSLTSDVAPIYEIENVPIEMAEDSLYQLTPVFSKTITEQDLNFIDHGYLNEYRFNAVAGEAYVIYLQFLSLDAHNTKQNIAINDSEGYNVIPDCEIQKISDYDNGVAYLCGVSVTGQWSIRILGIKGESIGGYIVGIKPI
jgi:hypothetical protein